ncbi:MAG: ATP-binding protein [Candidatus Hodarchaeales archaeon]|jgi:ferredoxin
MQTKKENVWSEEELVSFQKKWNAKTIPVNIHLKSDHIALNFEKIKKIIYSSKKIAVADCDCRQTLQNCDQPLNVCLWLDDAAEKTLGEGRSKLITKEKAEKIIKLTHDKGLVHLTLFHPYDEKKTPQVVCSCCSCCCHALQGLKIMNMNDLIEPSELVAFHDPNYCIHCGICTDRCQFEARTLSDDNQLIFDQNKCFGCGLCLSNCSEDIIKLQLRD